MIRQSDTQLRLPKWENAVRLQQENRKGMAVRSVIV